MNLDFILRRNPWLYEAAEDQGNESVDEPIPLDQIDDPVKRAIVRQHREDDRTPPVEEASEEGDEESSDDDGEPKLYAGKFKTLEEWEKAHKDLEAFWHEHHQKNQEEDVEADELSDQDDPFAALRDASLVGFQPQDPTNYEELASLMGQGVQGAQQAAAFILKNHQFFPAEVRTFVLQNWGKEDPVGYNHWYFENMWKAREQQLMEQITPAIQDVQTRNLRAAYEDAANQLPEFGKYEPLMKAAIEQYPQLFTEQDVAGGHQAIVDGLKRVYTFVRGQELVSSGGATPPSSNTTEDESKRADTKPAPQRVRTTTRTNPPRGSEQDETTRSRDQGIRSLIREAR